MVLEKHIKDMDLPHQVSGRPAYAEIETVNESN